MIDRRKFIFGAGTASLFCAPAIIRPGILMPIKRILFPPLYPGEIDLSLQRDIHYWVTSGKLDEWVTLAGSWGIPEGGWGYSPGPLGDDPVAKVKRSIDDSPEAQARRYWATHPPVRFA